MRARTRLLRRYLETYPNDRDRFRHYRAELQLQRAELAHMTRISTLGELSASLAHELNQPLTAILSNAQAAQRFLAVEPLDLSELRENSRGHR